MSDLSKNDDRPGDDKSLENLLRLAGERPEIPFSVESRVYNRVQQEWQESTASPAEDKVYAQVHRTWKRDARRGRIMRWALPFAVAASAVLVVLMVTRPEPVAPRVAATVASVIVPGTVQSGYEAGASVYEGDLITTGDGGGVSLLLARNASLRVDENTSIRIDSSDHFTLLGGRVYADTGQFIYNNGGLQIDTDFGVVRDVGTQFAVSSDGDSMDVSVREGRVELTGESDVHVAKMGERLSIASGQGASLSELDTHDPYWNWIVELTPAFDLNNRSLLDFLNWAARETGRELRFENDESRMFAMRTDIHGSVEGLTPNEALAAILSTTTLSYRIDTDKVVLGHDTTVD